ncbi:hypothetical protein QN277_001392 [Acacia crassicarpa]|uniref:BHLH domain-containing protein n=1 Tax=Acacia crassicarpa TaxID=499986 RepID=A0AAE1N720_9FABA|nr:hypothetical protein QN277_001392 [Acacia crassicarpa]
MSSDNGLSKSSDVTAENSLREISPVDRRRQSRASLMRRNRRKKMRLSFRELQDLVPSVNHIRADRATIVEETIKYIKTLELMLEKLEKMKRERLPAAGSAAMAISPVPQNPIGFQTWVFPNVAVYICGEKAQFSMCFPKKEDLYSEICCVLNKYNIQILVVSISTNNYRSTYKIHTRAQNRENSEGSSEACSMEETFKKAARDIYLLSPM